MSDWKVIFYQEENGDFPVKDFIVAQPYKARAEIIHVFELLDQFNIRLNHPYTAKVNEDIWELRIKHSSNYYRILYATVPGKIFLLLHGFLKKTDELPSGAKTIAMSRLNRYRSL